MGDSAGAPALAETDEEPFLDAAWTEAIEATELLRAVLSDLGLADCVPRLRGDVNVYGRPMVTIGRIEPAAARRLAAALSLVEPGLVGAEPGRVGAEPGRVGAEPGRVMPPPRFGGDPMEGAKDLPPPVSGVPAPMPAPRIYGSPGSTHPSDDLQASALRLMRLYGGPAAPAQPADVRDPNAPESWTPMLAAFAVPAPAPAPDGEPTQRGEDAHRLPA
jgi:hypothetical protein